MVTINVSDRIKTKCPQIALGVIQFTAIVKAKDENLWMAFSNYCNELAPKLKEKNLKEFEEIKSGRIAYKSLGRDPDRYNVSSEALLKRVKNGKEMYQINNLVDTNNFLSVQSHYSIGMYDLNKTQGAITFDYGSENEVYESLAKGLFDVTNLPIFRDSISGFGSPTSDSKRTAISLEASNILMILISFNGEGNLSYWLEIATQLLSTYSSATNIETQIVK